MEGLIGKLNGTHGTIGWIPIWYLYPSDFEGFGNAFLETVYFRKPLVVNRYSIYNTDLKPKGFQVIEFDGFISQKTVEQTKNVLKDEELRREMVNRNFEIAQKHYSYSVLQKRLHNLIASPLS